MGLYGGESIFGVCTSFVPSFEPTAEQLNAFFGVNGVQAIHGGERGVTVLISGVFFGLTEGDVVNQEGLMLSYRDGIARTLVDNFGRVYPNVLLTSTYQPWEHGVKPAYLMSGGPISGFAMSYKMVARSLGA